MANVVQVGVRTSIEDQARKWLIRMDGDEPLSSAEREALQGWMSLDTSHREELSRMSRFWHQANILTELICDLELGRLERKERRRSSLTGTLLMAAGALLSLGLLIQCMLQPLDGTVTRTYGYATGKQTTVTLPGDSPIQLDTNGRVTLAQSAAVRRIDETGTWFSPASP